VNCNNHNPSIRLLLVTQDRDARKRFASVDCVDVQVMFADCAATGREGLTRLAAWRPNVALVALPLPDLSGVEFVRAAKRALASCQILLVAAAGAEEALIAAIEAGAAGCVLEPCDARELLGHALKLRAGGSPLSPLVARKLVERLHARTLLRAAAAVLTARESDVVSLLANGLSYSQIGDRLGVSLNTVGSHIKNAYRKLDVHSATAAVMRAVELQMPGRAWRHGDS
jgi:DNA-binding NarL/FixJ family response regulator